MAFPPDTSYVTANYQERGGARWVIGGELEIADAGALKVAGVDVTAALAALAAGGATPAQGVAAGYKIARGTANVTGTGDITTGLATVVAVVAVQAADFSLNAAGVTAVPGGTAGHITVKVWKPTSNIDGTPIASSTATAVDWIAVGT